MTATLKSELRKLTTIRSTYLITAFVLAITSLLSFFAYGYKIDPALLASSGMVHEQLYSVISTFATFAAILSILLVAHEYRYNTIGYTLTLSKSRLKVLFSKITALLMYATVVGAAVLGAAYAASQIGLAMKGATLSPQVLSADIIWQFLAYTWGYVLTGVIIAVLVRGLVGSIVALLLIPMAEQLLSLVLKDNTKYLPFRSLDAVAVSTTSPAPFQVLSNMAGFGVFCIYLAVLGGAAVWLFVHRDAN